MAYCTVENVQAVMQTTFSHSSGFPLYDDVQEYVDTVSSNLDGVLQAAGYTVPVTAADAVALLKRYNTFGAACQAYHAGYRTEDILPPHAEYWCQEYRDFLSRIRKGEQQLPGLEPEGDIDPVFMIVQTPPRDRYFTGQDESLE
jgi:hypothetical protein